MFLFETEKKEGGKNPTNRGKREDEIKGESKKKKNIRLLLSQAIISGAPISLARPLTHKRPLEGLAPEKKKVQQIFFSSKYSYKTLGIFIGRPVNVSMDQSLLARWSACHSRLCQCWYLRPRRFLLFVDFMTLSVPFLTSNYHKRCW